MAKMSNAEFLQSMLDINTQLKEEGKPKILSEKLENKISDVLKNAKKMGADQEITNVLFNKLFKDPNDIKHTSKFIEFN